MRAIRDEPLLTSAVALSEFLPDPSSAYVYGTSVEERSGHSRDLELRATAVTFVKVLDQEPASFSVDLRGTIRTVMLRSRAQVERMLDDIDEDTIYLDVTGLSHHVWAPILKFALARKSRVVGVYVEPGDYRPSNAPTETEIFDLSERILGVSPLPGFASLTEPGEQNVCFVPLLGFEGTRFAHILEHVQPLGGKIVPVVGVPGFRAEYPFYTYHGNKASLLSTRSWRNIRFARANCPFSLFYALQSIAAEFPRDTLKVAPIGTKPHAIGAVLFALASARPVEIVYDHPIRKSSRTAGAARLLLYQLSAMPLLGART